LCRDARGTDGVDFDSSGSWKDKQGEKVCRYTETRLRELYPEYKDLSYKTLVQKAFAKLDVKVEPVPTPWDVLLRVVIMALLVPISVLLLGAAIGWVVTGFRTTTAAR
jgi:hypothetical protein